MRRAARILLLASLGLLSLRSGRVVAQEQITSFEATLNLAADGALQVIERITVRAEGSRIQHGIYRDFPVAVRTRWGARRDVPFEVVAVRRDGGSEAWRVSYQDMPGMARVVMGRSDVKLAPGLYTYELEYRTHGHIRYGSTSDELIWNVTGNAWALPILNASAHIHLPDRVDGQVTEMEIFTGKYGDQGRDGHSGLRPGGIIEARATRVLNPGEGLTVRIAWPAGLIPPPGRAEAWQTFWRANRSLVVSLLGLVGVLAYYLVMWDRVGRDPEAQARMAMFEPPPGYSPAAIRFIRRMGHDRKGVSTAIVDLAVRGALRIEERDGTFTLEATRPFPDHLPAAEKSLLRALFKNGDALDLTPEHHAVVGKAIESFREHLHAEYETRYFVTNRRWFLGGLVVSVLTVIAANLMGRILALSLFMSVWLSIWSVAVGFLLTMVVRAWRHALGQSGGLRALGLVGALMTTAFALPFVAAEGVGLWFLSQSVGVPTLVVYVVLGLVNVAFYHLLKAPTLAGRALLDQAEGLRMFLGSTERHRLEFLTPVQSTPAQFERLLPYAMALDVENAWVRRFEEAFPHLTRDPGPSSGSNGSSWYICSGRSMPWTAVASGVGGALAGSLAAAATAPSSSGGGGFSGGGSFSGGGGGGGGGGGW